MHFRGEECSFAAENAAAGVPRLEVQEAPEVREARAAARELLAPAEIDPQLSGAEALDCFGLDTLQSVCSQFLCSPVDPQKSVSHLLPLSVKIWRRLEMLLRQYEKHRHGLF